MKHFLFVFLLGCSANNPNVFDPVEADVQDASVDDQDATVPQLDTGYDPCVKMTQVPTSYSRLMERDCIDSNGVSYMKDYFDTQLQLGCHWKPASDKVRCLPENELSSPLYSDPGCSQGIAPVEVNNQAPVQPYVGLDHYDDAGLMDYIDMFGIGDPWSGQYFFHQEYDQSFDLWDCNAIYFHFPGSRMYYVDAGVDPSIFQEQ